jgi:hypothetical protein
VRVSERDRSRGAQLRAERIRWRVRSPNVSQALRSMDERLRKMNEHGGTLDERLHRHAEETKDGTWLGRTRRRLAASTAVVPYAPKLVEKGLSGSSIARILPVSAEGEPFGTGVLHLLQERSEEQAIDG